MTKRFTTIDIGDRPEFPLEVRLLGALADPDTSITFELREPDNVLTTYVYGLDPELVKTGVGQYKVAFVVTKPGTHYFTWSTTGSAHGSESGEFGVRKKPT